MMKELLDKIETFHADSLPATESQIKEAESRLNITFSDEYRSYLLQAGVISFESWETYGLGVPQESHLNILNALNYFREFDGFPDSFLPLMDIGDGHHYVYDNNNQKVLSLALPGLGSKEISNNLEDFLISKIFN